MSTQQPEALRLAHTLSGGKLIDDSTEWADTLHAAGDELRRLYDRVTELEAEASDNARIIGASAETELALRAQEDGWLQDGHMLYRLTDEPRPRNRDEIIVTMVNGSRAEAARTKRASEILYAIRTAEAEAEAGKVMK